MRAKIRFILILLVLGGAGYGIYFYANQTSRVKTGTQFRSVALKRGDITATISATGTVEPEEVVDVGAQVAGQINTFGKDVNGKPIDYGSVVGENTILAQIDESLYSADVASARAQMLQAEANVASAEANVNQSQAKLSQARQDWERAQKLGPSEALAPSAFDQYKANFEVATANLSVAKSAVGQAKAAVALAQANIDRSQRNLSYCTIKSPVKGVIIDRRVNIGQTVVASLNAPSLFLIAKDLTRVQVWVSVNEADIGNIRAGMPATFTVDAFPGRVFKGMVSKVRLNATMTQNVVTYTVEVTTDNSDGRLLPYMTANVLFVTGTKKDVFVATNAALRYKPRAELIAPEFRAKMQEKASGGAGRKSSRADGLTTETRGTLWEKQGEFLKPVRVTLGLTDGATTEVDGADLEEDMQLITGELTQQTDKAMDASTGASPFVPQPGRARGNAASGSAGAGGERTSGGGSGGGGGRPGGF